MSSTHDDQSISAMLVAAHSSTPSDRALLESEVLTYFQPMTHALAHRYVRRGVEADDLEQVADLALLKAMRRFDPASGHLRGFVAATVLGEIKKYFRDHAWTIRPPRHIQDLQPLVMEAEASITPDLSGMTRSAKVADILGIDRSVVCEVLVARTGFRALSLDWDADHEGIRFVDQLQDQDDPHQETERHHFVSYVCAGLDDDDRLLLHLRFVEELSQTQIAMRLQSSQKQVSRSLERILSSLRHRALSDAA